MNEEKQNELIELLNEIEKREESLEENVEKTRNALKTFFNVFGNSYFCRICNTSESDRVHYRFVVRKDGKGYESLEQIKQYYPGYELRIVSPKEHLGRWGLEGNVLLVDENPGYHEFIPKIGISFTIEDHTPFFKEDVTGADIAEYYLAINGDHELVIRRRIKVGENTLTKYDYTVTYAPRRVLRALLKSGRIVAFLNYLVETLKEKEKQYKEVAEIAEKIANAVKV